MKNWQKFVLQLMTGTITFYLVYLLVGLIVVNAFPTSLEPGWHTTIYPFGGKLHFTIIIMSLAIFTYFLFKYVLKFVTYLWVKMFP